MLLHTAALVCIGPLAPAAFQDAAQVPGELGAFAFEIDALEDPSAAVIGPGDLCWIAEAASGRVRVFDDRGTARASFGTRGRSEGELLEPRGIALGVNGDVLVSDAGNHRISFFDASGKYLRSIGRLGAALGELNTPRGLCADERRIYVADSRNDRVQVFDRRGLAVLAIGSRGTAQGKLLSPSDVAVDAQGNVYVADCDNDRVQKFDADGKFLKSWGDFGPFPGQFASPSGIAVARDRVYVDDRENHRVQVFDLDGQLLYEWAVHALRPHEGQGKLHYPDDVAVSRDGSFALICEGFEDRAQAFGPQKPPDPSEPPPLPPERNVAAHYGPGVASAGNLIAVLEPGASAVLLFRAELPEPIQITQAGVHGTRSGELLHPCDAAIDLARREVYVSDPANGRIVSYRIAGDFEGELKNDPYLLRFARSLDFEKLHALAKDLGAKWMVEPRGLALDAQGNLFVADPRNRAVWIVSAAFEIVARFGDGGSDALLRPGDVAIGGDARRYVTDELAGVVRVFDAKNQLAATLAAPDMHAPFGVVVAKDGVVWVSDSRAHQIFRFDAENRFAGAFGARGLGTQEFYKPKGLALDGRGEPIVIDWGNHRGIVFSAGGDPLGSFGSRLFTKAFRGGR
jgi:DNA-binding beta-propeller fold protein YncE